MEPLFDHERLRVYQEAIAFVGWWTEVSEAVPGKLAAKDQLEWASTSIPLNVPEGNGKHSSRDRCHYLDIARGSALECAAGLDVLVAKKQLTRAEVEPGKLRLHAIVSMLVRLRGSIAGRVGEERAEYVWEGGDEDE